MVSSLTKLSEEYLPDGDLPAILTMHLLSTVDDSVLAACLLAAYYLLLTAYCLLLTAHCPLLTAHCFMFPVSSFLFLLCSFLFPMYCPLPDAYY